MTEENTVVRPYPGCEIVHVICEVCKGSGVVPSLRHDGFDPCPRCKGEGWYHAVQEPKRKEGGTMEDRKALQELRKAKKHLEQEIFEFLTEKINSFQRDWGVGVCSVDVDLIELREADNPHAGFVVKDVRVEIDL